MFNFQRDCEYQAITGFLKERFRTAMGGGMYISGTPGTGSFLTLDFDFIDQNRQNINVAKYTPREKICTLKANSIH